MIPIVKNNELLEEGHKVNDLLDFSVLIKAFTTKLNKISSNSVVGLIGAYGSGKSTMLYQLYKDEKKDSASRWIIFDAWKYPDRNDLWQGFVLDFADQLGEKKKMMKKIDGKSTKSAIVDIGTDIVGLITDKLPDLSILDKFTEIFKAAPATRVFELQAILKEIIEKIDKEIYIIVEDIDRSGDKGVYFLETLRNFIKENKFDKKIVIIVPIGKDSFYSTDNSESYAKCLDYHFLFNGVGVDFSNYLKEIFTNEYLSTDANIVNQINLFLKTTVSARGSTIRDIKKILRLSILVYEELVDEYKDLDFRLVLFFTTGSYYRDPITNHSRDGRRIIKPGTPGYDYLIWIANSKKISNTSTLKNYVEHNANIASTNERLATPFVFYDRELFEGDRKATYLICDFYFTHALSILS